MDVTIEEFNKPMSKEAEALEAVMTEIEPCGDERMDHDRVISGLAERGYRIIFDPDTKAE